MLAHLFYIISFSLSIIASFINISLGLLTIIIVTTNRQCRTVANTMMCNTAAATMIYSVLQMVSAGYGLQKDWFSNQPACIFRAYCYVAVCIAVSGSYASQSISRLFFAVLYKHKYLLSWRVHWFIIMINYFLAMIGSIPPIFFRNGYGLEGESHLCMASTHFFYSSMLAVTTAYLIPLSIVIIVYTIILSHVRQSARRVRPLVSASVFDSSVNSIRRPNFKREMKLMRNIFILVSIHICAGIPYFVLVLWNATQMPPRPPESIYLWAMITISVCFALKMIVLLCMNKEMKHVVLEYLRKLKQFRLLLIQGKKI